MDFQFNEAAEKLRLEAQTFLQEHALVPSRDDSKEAFEEARAFNRKLVERGWIALAWPKEYGGLGASIFEQVAFNEVFGYYGSPGAGARGAGVGLLGPTLIVHGTEDQKAKYLPKITSCEHNWCQGYSEPGAGSDLASLQTRAVRDGDDYVINGQKIWTSGGHRANQMFLLARTDPDAPKHKGISFLLIDDIQHTPGLTIRPLINMANRHSFNEVFFEDVRIPASNIVGEENRGWYVGMTLLDFERSGIGQTGSQRRVLEELTDELRNRTAKVRPNVRHELADLVVGNNVGRQLGYRIAHIQASGDIPNYEASVSKIFQSELQQHIYKFGVKVLGLHGLLMPEEPRAPYKGDYPEGYIQAVPTTIYGGSNEIQRNIIATRGLGLPRG